MERLTDLDKRLLSALRNNGREPIATLAQMLGVSRATVTKRIDRLTASGVIVGFTVRVRDQAEIDQVRAISVIEVEGRTTDHVIRELRGFPEIQALHTTNGDGTSSSNPRAPTWSPSTTCCDGSAGSTASSTANRACCSAPSCADRRGADRSPHPCQVSIT